MPSAEHLASRPGANAAGVRIGLLTSGGDCPGINAAIRGVGKTAIRQYGMEVIGFVDGFHGLVAGQYVELKESMLSGILTLGGTILGTSREKPFATTPGEDPGAKPKQMLETVERMGLDCVVCIGGNGTMKTANKLSRAGVNVVGVPKTIDNDVWGTDRSFGFDSALAIATEAIDRLHTTANSHRRVMVVEVMGHSAGWLALTAGVAGGGDVILMPEIPWDARAVGDYLQRRAKDGHPYSIVVVAEGIALPPEAVQARTGAARWVAECITAETGLETRETVLGYIQRGGSPTPGDRILATRLGTAATNLIAKARFGRMVALQGSEMTCISLRDTAGKLNLVPPDHRLVREARTLGVCFGD
ncbi:MAG TPA: ATP-dependent 6-phosphofructokinase [Acidimicrobiales bacterium]|nr:ATP-dependent 6-phosphofructokinase [Acidimicrobiales bacterium]